MSFLTTFLSAPYWLVSFLVLVLSFLTGCGAGVNASQALGVVGVEVAELSAEAGRWPGMVLAR